MPRIRHRPTAAPRVESRPIRIAAWQWFLLAAGVPLIICLRKLNLDLWHDEIYTVVEYAARGPGLIVTDYSTPNNHILYSLVLWPFTRLSTLNLVLRLPSLAATLGTLLLVYRTGRRLAGPAAGLLAVLLLGLTQMFLLLAMQIRGYSLSMLLMAALVELATPAPYGMSWRRAAGIVMLGAAFLYVLPTNLLMFVPLAAFAVAWPFMARRTAGAAAQIGRRGWHKVLIESGAWLGAGLLALACYGPVLNQIGAHSRQAESINFSAAWMAAVRFFSPATRDAWLIAPLVAAGLVCWLLRVRRTETGSEVAIALSAVVVVTGTFLLTALLRISPFARNYCPLLPELALAAGWWLAELVEAARRRWLSDWPAELASVPMLLAVGAILGPHLWTYPARLAEYRRQHRMGDGYFEYYAADYHPAAVVDWFVEHNDPRQPFMISYPKEDDWNLWYYFYLSDYPQGGNLPAAGGPWRAQVFVIAPETADFSEMAGQLNVPVDQVRSLPLVADFGYYRLYRSAEPLLVEPPTE